LLAFRLSIVISSLRRAFFAKSIEDELENIRFNVSSPSIILHDGEELFKIARRRKIKPLVFENIQDIVPRSTQPTFLLFNNIPEKLLRGRATLAYGVGIAIVILNERNDLTPFGSGINFSIAAKFSKEGLESVTSLALFSELSVLLLLLCVVEPALQGLHMVLESSQNVKLGKSLVLFVILERRGR